MSVYLVTWDLNKEKSNYADARARFLSNLKEYDRIKDSDLDSVYFISTDSTADQVSKNLQFGIDDNDRLIVIKFSTGNHQGWLSQEIWDWINNRL